MRKYRVYGWHITQCGDTWCDSVYDEIITANNPDEAIKQAIQWNIEESCTGEYDADRDMVIYQDEYEISEDSSHICITVSNDLMNNFLEDYGDAA